MSGKRRSASPRTYLRTTDLARAIGVHPNTVRLYEAWGFLSPVPRSPKGYRLFTELHLDQLRLARTALHWPYPGGKEPVLDLVFLAAAGDLEGALGRARDYLAQVQCEIARAEAAVAYLERWAARGAEGEPGRMVSIRKAAQLLHVSTDALRNWERNGLIAVPRDPRNRYRRYGAAELDRLRVIRTLRQANYSMMAILRMLQHLDAGRPGSLRQVLDTPREDEDAIYITDRWLSTLAAQEVRARAVIAQLEAMVRKYQVQGKT